MSEHTFYILPSDPDYLPSVEQQRAFEEYFMQVLGVADSHYVHLRDAPMLVGDGEVSHVQCPACEATLRMFTPDYHPSPHYAWHESVRDLPANSTCQMPCCGAQVKAIYVRSSPAYPYARFARGALNPEMDQYWNEEGTELALEVVDRFERLLGTPIRQLWVSGT